MLFPVFVHVQQFCSIFGRFSDSCGGRQTGQFLTSWFACCRRFLVVFVVVVFVVAHLLHIRIVFVCVFCSFVLWFARFVRWHETARCRFVRCFFCIGNCCATFGFDLLCGSSVQFVLQASVRAS